MTRSAALGTAAPGSAACGTAAAVPPAAGRAAAAPSASGVRIGWENLPDHVRAAVEDELGAPVIAAVTQAGGFSPGAAARLLTARGERVFLKAVSPAQNPRTPEIHRREIGVAALLPAGLPVARLRWSYDDGYWVAMLLDDVEGRPPLTPWRDDELAGVLDAVGALHRMLTPAPVGGLQSVAERHAGLMRCWPRLAADPPAGLDPWSRRHLGRLVELAKPWADGAAGDTLLHCDLRADNILIRDDGSVVVVDWPWACVGAPWFDVALLAPSVTMQGGPPPEQVLARCSSSADVAPEGLAPTVVAFAGYFTWAALQPPAPGLPTVRAFQAAQGVIARAWASRLTGLR